MLVTFPWHHMAWRCRHEDGSLVAIFRFRVSSLPVQDAGVFRVQCFVTASVSSVCSFCPKEVPFNFLLLNGEIEKLTWAWVIDVFKFREKHFIDAVTDISYRKFKGDQSFGVAMTNIQTFSEVRSLDVTLSDLGLKFSHARKRCRYNKVCQKVRSCAPPLPDGVSTTPPPPTRVKVNGGHRQMKQKRKSQGRRHRGGGRGSPDPSNNFGAGYRPLQ